MHQISKIMILYTAQILGLYSDMETLITVLVIEIAIIVGALYLLFAKY